MFKDPSEKSLAEIIQSRCDTVFKAHTVNESQTDVLANKRLYQDEIGNYYYHSHDYIGTKVVEGEPVGVLVADEDGRNSMDHPHSHLPHLMGLYVREPFRSAGITSELVHDFMTTVEDNKCVVDCTDDLIPFYKQLDCEIIYLQSFKRDMDPTQPPVQLDPESSEINK
jgi:GNAT superfamily N-acetyltransferase